MIPAMVFFDGKEAAAQINEICGSGGRCGKCAMELKVNQAFCDGAPIAPTAIT